MLKHVTFSNLYSYEDTYQINFDSEINMYAIYGELGSGKSNLLNLLESITHSIWDKPNYQQLRTNICKHSNSQIIDISFSFVWNQKDYLYSIALNPFTEKILFQELKYSRFNKILFRFTEDDITSDFMTTVQTEMLSTFDVQNYGVQYYIANLSDYGIITEIKQLIAAARIQDYLKIDINRLSTDDSIRNQIIKLFNILGINIIDIVVDSPQTDFIVKVQSTAGEKNSAIYIDETTAEYRFIYESYEIKLIDESAGVKKLFELFLEIFLGEHDHFFTPRIIDDIGCHLHPNTVYQLLALYKKYCSRQLVIATDNQQILEEKLFPKESFFFLNKTINHISITSLASFKDLRSDHRHNWNKMYAEGKFGGCPQLKDIDLQL